MRTSWPPTRRLHPRRDAWYRGVPRPWRPPRWCCRRPARTPQSHLRQSGCCPDSSNLGHRPRRPPNRYHPI